MLPKVLFFFFNLSRRSFLHPQLLNFLSLGNWSIESVWDVSAEKARIHKLSDQQEAKKSKAFWPFWGMKYCHNSPALAHWSPVFIRISYLQKLYGMVSLGWVRPPWLIGVSYPPGHSLPSKIWDLKDRLINCPGSSIPSLVHLLSNRLTESHCHFRIWRSRLWKGPWPCPDHDYDHNYDQL